jgi:hypothetical protein
MLSFVRLLAGAKLDDITVSIDVPVTELFIVFRNIFWGLFSQIFKVEL